MLGGMEWQGSGEKVFGDFDPGVPWSSWLGFGTSALMSRVNRRDSVRLLETALEQGITHFDTARSYGFGEAELAVGDALAGQRDRVTVTTKLGILPPRRSSVLSLGKAVARGLLAVAPGVRSAVRQGAGTLTKAGHFSAGEMESSLHTSLRQLRTDYVDLLLLHEPSMEVLSTTEPLQFLQAMREAGKIRSFGIAATPEVAMHALLHTPAYAPVLQFPHSVFDHKLKIPALPPAQMTITHSALGSPLGALLGELKREAQTAAQWSEALGGDVMQPGFLAQLALQWSHTNLPGSTVLFASTQPQHIRENAAAMRATASPEQLERFASLVSGWVQRR